MKFILLTLIFPVFHSRIKWPHFFFTARGHLSKCSVCAKTVALRQVESLFTVESGISGIAVFASTR